MMICRDKIKTVIKDYVSEADDKKIDFMVDIVARELEISAYELIRQFHEEDKLKHNRNELELLKK